jgi:histidinol dehydrogenase
VGEIVVVTPPRSGGGLDPAVAFAAEQCGIEAIWTVGGAQAIAALAFGAGPIPAVDKICGPGNAWVAEAKNMVAGMVGGPAIDLPAGPSELMVIADRGADPAIVAADLLSQAEHDAAAQVLLVTDCERVAERVLSEVQQQVVRLPRQGAVQGSLRNARFIVAGNLEAAVEIANLYAPEHLSLAVSDADSLIDRIRNAGAVFVGGEAAETIGDYLAGSSHVLPTDGAARAWSGINVHSFMKSISLQTLTKEAARAVAAPAALMARLEGLEAHALAAEARGQEVPS